MMCRKTHQYWGTLESVSWVEPAMGVPLNVDLFESSKNEGQTSDRKADTIIIAPLQLWKPLTVSYVHIVIS